VARVADAAQWWYFPAHGLLAAVFFALLDVPSWVFYWPAVLAVLGAAASLGWFAKRRQPVTPHWSLYGVRGWAGIGAAIAVFFVGVTSAGLYFEASGIERPGAVTGIIAGVLLAVLGTLLRFWLRREIVRRAGEGGR
jgi:hypothetical protein